MTNTTTPISILSELEGALQAVSCEELDQLADQLLAARAIFVCGAGRSGLMMRAFAMRLMHLNLHAYVVGESVTPSVGAGDLLLVGSGSGQTKSLVAMAEKAKSLGAAVAAVTIDRNSSIGLLSSRVVTIPAQAKDASSGSIQPMGSLFEQALLLVLDSLVLRLMERRQMTAQMMYGRHANLE